MVDASALRQIFSLQSAAWTATAFLFLLIVRMWNGAPAMFAQWISYRQARAAEKAADWHRLREEILRLSDAEKRCREDYTVLHSQHMELHNEHAELSRRVAELEGYQIGKGQVRQELTIFEAAKRVEKDKP